MAITVNMHEAKTDSRGWWRKRTSARKFSSGSPVSRLPNWPG